MLFFKLLQKVVILKIATHTKFKTWYKFVGQMKTKRKIVLLLLSAVYLSWKNKMLSDYLLKMISFTTACNQVEIRT